MPQIWTQDQRPQLMIAGTDALARGISEGAGGLSKALADIGKKKKDEASLANVLRKKGALLQPDRKDEFAVMSKDELVAEDEAFTVGKALEREAAQQAQRQQQIDLMLRKAAMDEAQSQAGAMALGRLGEQGQDPASVAAPFSNEEFDRRTRQPNLSDVMRELGTAGQATGGGMDLRQVDDLSRAIASQGRGRMAPPPGMVAKSATIDGITYGNPKDEKPMLEDHPWLYDDDMEKVKEGIRGIKDPQQRALAIGARNDYEVMQGRPGLLERLLMGDMGSGGKPPPGAKSDGPKAGDVEDGYRFKGGNRADPKNWEKVK